MINILRQNGRLKEALFLIAFTSLCLGLSLFRVFYSGNSRFLFLNWNLFLAFIPWLLTSIVALKPTLQKRKGSITILWFSWLLFFPNAPYILTDLFHLRNNSDMPIWFDLVLILSFAWTGLIFGFLSLWDIERMMAKKIRPNWIAFTSTLLLFLSSFGIYLGRYLRWNSWDVVQDPAGLMYDIGSRVVHPTSHPRTWGMTIFMGLLLSLIYWSFKLMGKRTDQVIPFKD